MLKMGKFSLEARLFMQNVGFVYEKKAHFIIVIDHLRLVCLKRQVKGNVTFFEGCFSGRLSRCPLCFNTIYTCAKDVKI